MRKTPPTNVGGSLINCELADQVGVRLRPQADLRSKKIRESRLDDFPGLGPVRRAALLGKFGDFDRLRAASVDEIREVACFVPKLGAALHAFLHHSESVSA